MNQEALDEQRKKIAKDFELYYELFPEERKLDKIIAKEKKDAQAKKDKSDLGKNQKQKRDCRKPKQLRKSYRVLEEAKNKQLLVIKEEASSQESDGQQDKNLRAKLRRSNNQTRLTNELIKIDPKQQNV